MKIAEIKEQSAEALAALLRDKEAELRTLRLRHNSTVGGIQTPGQLAVLRRDIARIKTVINQKKVNQ